MRFVLHYRGPLHSNGNPSHKHELRRVFHQQLKTLWGAPPLNEQPDLLQPRRKGYSLLRPFGPFTFVPLVTAEMNVVAAVTVTMLRPEPPGKLVTQGGDIDNRLKTLFDALTVPRHQNALPAGIMPSADESPFFCLLEDDNLITSIAVNTEQLLEPGIDASVADIYIEVVTSVTRHTMGNMSFS
jgi:hypothetical protein